MFFKQFYLGCLAQASYLIGSEGEAAVVDPRRDVDEYMAEAERLGLRIKYVIETHLHADFVSGHQELAERTGARIAFGAAAKATFPHLAVKENDEIHVGKVVLRFLETPGHTPESISILVIDTETSGEPKMVLTGDTLFIGDVGRPDLVSGDGLTPEAMAGMLYESLHQKLLRLRDEVQVYPAHGAGSLCGRNISKETFSTVGEQRRTNYALQRMSRDQFVRMMTIDLPEVPAYFARDVAINRQGAAPLASRPRPAALSPDEIREERDRGVVILDVRDSAAFGTAHVPGSMNIGLAGEFASWAGTFLDARRLAVVADADSKVDEAVMRLARVGLETVVGYLDGGLASWYESGLPLGKVPQLPVNELHRWIQEDGDRLQVLDVRRPAEYRAGHLRDSMNIPLYRLAKDADHLNPDRPTAVVCAGGYRSSIATSLLLQRGYGELFNVVGGMSAWVAAGYGTTLSAGEDV